MELRNIVCAATLALAAGAAGCSVQAGASAGPGPGPGEPVVTQGTLSIAWTVNGSVDPAECDYYGADALQIDLYDADDMLLATDTPYCDAFIEDIDLDPGDYTVDLTLVDTLDHPVSTTLSLTGRIHEDTETDLDIDFPDSSFF